MAIENPIQLNMADRIAVRQNLIDRCTAVVTNYALYLLGNMEATVGQKNWALSSIRNPKTVGDAVSWYVLNQPSYLNGGSSIEDAELIGIVETAINMHLVVEPL
jgi:hypothetical protein